MWQFVALAAIAASQYMSGQNTKSSLYQRARQTREFGQFNAYSMERAGVLTSQMQTAVSGFNASMAWLGGNAEAKTLWDRAQYNAMVVSYAAEHNAALSEMEAADIWQKADLDIELLHQARAAERGDITVAYAHNGVELNTMDTPAQALLDSQVAEELDNLIVRFNADNAAQKALDAAATSRWEGKVARKQILWEGNENAKITLLNAGIRRATITTQGGMDAMMTRLNAYNRSDSILYQAYYDASSLEAQGDTAGANGLFGGISSFASGVIGYFG